MRRAIEVVDLQATGPPKLKRSLGLWMATALVVGNMVGSGVFLLPSSLAGIGSVSLLGWLLTGTGAVLLALVFANLGRRYPRTGGPYAYAHRAFGEFVGFETAWGYWIAAWVGNAAIATAFVGYLAVFAPTVATNHLLGALVALAIIWTLTFVNIAGVRQGGIVQVATTVLKFVPLLAIGVIGLFFMKGGNFHPFVAGTGGSLKGITTAAALTLWAFIGLESSTVPAEEVKDPERNIPRSTIIGTVSTTALYVLATIAVMGIIPMATLANSTSPFADAARTIFNTAWVGKAIAVVAMISTFGALNGWILLQGRVPLAAAQDGLFPKQFAKLSGTRHTPVFGLVVSSIGITVVTFMFYNQSLVSMFTQVILLATLTTLVPYAFAAAAQALLFFTDRERFSGRRFAKDGTIATLAFAYSVWAIWGSGFEIIAKGFILLLVGIPVFIFMKWRLLAPKTIELREVSNNGHEDLSPIAVHTR